MPRSLPALIALAALALSACSFADDTLWPSLSGEDPRGAQAGAAARAAPAAASPAAAVPAATGGGLPQLRRDLARLKSDVEQHRGELKRLRQELDQLENGVDTLASGIASGLKSRRTPDDPQLLNDWNRAQAQLNRAGEATARLNTVSSWATSDAALASYVAQAIRAAAGDPQTSAADRRSLAGLEREADQASNDVEQLVAETSGEIARRGLFIAAAQRRLGALGAEVASGGEAPGPAPPGRTAAAAPTAATAATPRRRALVTIRFDRPDVAYQQQLYEAVSEALARRPALALDIVAVSPPGRPSADTAERNVEGVVNALTSMGMPPERLRLSAATLPDATGNEVRIYPR